MQKKLTTICTKLIFKRLLLKFATECKFTFLNNLYQKTEECATGGPISVTFADIYLVKLGNVIVAPFKPKLYMKYADMFNRRKDNTNEIPLERLNNYHLKIKLTIELDPEKFLDTRLVYVDGTYKTMKFNQNYQSLGHLKYLNVINTTPILGILFDQKTIWCASQMELNKSKLSF